MSLSTIICAYTLDRWDDLTDAIAAVQNQSLPPDETIVVIDHNPALLERARSAFPSVTVLANQGKRGLSGARNTGVKAARGELLVFLDEDALPEPGWLEKLAQEYQDHQVMGVGGAIDPLWLEKKPRWFPEEFLWVVGCTYRGMPRKAASVRNLIGANMSFRSEVFRQAGGFSEDLGRTEAAPAGCEETEFSIRARQRLPGGVLLYQPEARVRHRVPPSRATWGYYLRRCYAEGLSKAQVTRLVGARDGLGTERAYTLRTLPLGVLRGAGGILRGDLSGLTRAAAILLGFTLTTAGYLLGKIKLRRAAPVLPQTLEAQER